MARYHINPNTGNPGPCHAEHACPFGGPESHYPSAENARKAFELSMGPEVFTSKKSKPTVQTNQSSDSIMQRMHELERQAHGVGVSDSQQKEFHRLQKELPSVMRHEIRALETKALSEGVSHDEQLRAQQLQETLTSLRS